MEFKLFQLSFGCVHTSGVKLPESSPPPSSVNAVNDLSLPTNISEDAQQTSGTYKNFHFIFGAHMCMDLFASVENSVMPVCKKGFDERAATVFETKVAKLFDNNGNQLCNKLIISGIFLLLFSPNASENDKFLLNDLFEDIKLFLETANSSDQSRLIGCVFFREVLHSSR